MQHHISQSGSTREAITKAEMEDFIIVVPEDGIAISFDQKVGKIILAMQILVQGNQKLLELQNLLLSKLAKIEG